MMQAVTGKQISFTYEYDGVSNPVLEDISIEIEAGEFIAILGANGCGKSTLVRLLNGLLPLEKGELKVWNLDPRQESRLWELRRLCGMVFQNPDNQFVSSIVEEDVAFGLRNYDTPEEEIPERVGRALSLVGMQEYERYSPHMLSGGQKQRVAMAGVLAMEPEILIFDEATSMLDPQGRREVLACLKQLHEMGKTILMITHYVEEVLDADRIFLMQKGKLLKSGSPREILTDRELLTQAELIPPLAVRIYYDLKDSGILLDRCPLTNEELVEELCRLK
ncbi:MAG TPA: energy-coupling factor transporter ATPase [Lachnospiraceae bacterium]|nr:energy-coupling factor transporter ATPase [Lachnospiraceae bacterium]